MHKRGPELSLLYIPSRSSLKILSSSVCLSSITPRAHHVPINSILSSSCYFSKGYVLSLMFIIDRFIEILSRNLFQYFSISFNIHTASSSIRSYFCRFSHSRKSVLWLTKLFLILLSILYSYKGSSPTSWKPHNALESLWWILKALSIPTKWIFLIPYIQCGIIVRWPRNVACRSHSKELSDLTWRSPP